MDGTFFADKDLAVETVEAGKVTRKIRARGGELMMVEVSFVAGAEGYAHEHPHEQATLCLSGLFDFTVAGRTERLRAGDSVFIAAGIRHGTRCIEAGRLLDVFTPQREDFLAKK
jgi:quercetin dioxygenase-like cupin family protein